MKRIINSGTPLLDGVTPDLAAKLSGCAVAYTQTYTKTLSKSPKGKFKETIRYLQKLLLIGCDEYYVYPEFTLMGEIHYHGFLKVKNQAAYQLMLPKLKNLGYIYMKAIDSVDKWGTYCTKNKTDMEKLLGIKLPITHDTKFTTTPPLKINIAPQETERGHASAEGASDGGAFPHEAKRSVPPPVQRLQYFRNIRQLLRKELDSLSIYNDFIKRSYEMIHTRDKCKYTTGCRYCNPHLFSLTN